MIDFLRGVFVALFSFLVVVFTPIKDSLIGMLILFAANGLFGLIADIMNGGGFKAKKALIFTKQCFIYYGTILFLFPVGFFLHKQEETATAIGVVSMITAWVFVANILRNCRACCPKDTPMYKIFDILYYIISVQVVEKIPFIASYIARKEGENNINK